MNAKLLSASKQRKADAETALKALEGKKQWYEKIMDDAETDRLQTEIAAADMAISTYSKKVNNYGSLRNNRQQEIQRYEHQIQLRITKLDANSLSAEKNKRVDDLTELATHFHTSQAQMEMGKLRFDQNIQIMDKLIETANKQEQAGIAEAMTKDRAQMVEARGAWLKGQQTNYNSAARDLEQAYSRNRADGIGPTDTDSLKTDIAEKARTKTGGATPPANFVDANRVRATANRAGAISLAAPGNTLHENNLETFATDVVITNVDTLTSDPTMFVERYVAFGKGSLRAVKDSVVDLLVLGATLAETAAQATEVAANQYTGLDSNLVGRDKINATYAGARNVGILLDADSKEAAELRKKSGDMAQSAGQAVDRYVSQQAARGDKGSLNMLDKTGYVVTTVADPVSKATGGSGKAGKGAGKADDLAAAGKADKLADAGKASRAPDAPTANAAAKSDRPSTGDKPASGRGKAATNADAWLNDTIDPELRAIAIEQSNMVPEHAEAFSKVAQRNGEILLFRPVNPHATKLIAEDAATKGMNIKGKSSNWGPQKGMIPVDPMYSKMGKADGSMATGVTKKKIKEYHELNKKALGQEWSKYENGKWVVQKRKKAIAQEIEVDGPNGKKIKVLADFSDPPRPITADYDLFAVSSKRGSGGMVDNPEQMAEMGNIGHNEVETMNRLNDAAKLAGYKGGNVVHHGAANRFANEFEAADFPILTLLPNGDAKLIQSAGELRKLYEKYANRGFKMDHMPGWDFGELTDAEKAARKAKGTAKRNAREAEQAAELERAPAVGSGSNLPAVLAGKAIRTGEEKAGESGASDGVSADEATTVDGSDGGSTLISVGGSGQQMSPVSPIYFAFGPGSWLQEEESWVSLPQESYVSLGDGAGFVLEGAISLDGTNIHSSSGLQETPPQVQVTTSGQPAQPPPQQKPKPKPEPKPQLVVTPQPILVTTPTPVIESKPKPVEKPAPVEKKPEARISTTRGGTIHKVGFSFACFRISFSGDVAAGSRAGVTVDGPGGGKTYDESLDGSFSIGLKHKIYSYGDYSFHVDYLKDSAGENILLTGNPGGSYRVDSAEDKAACD